MAIMKYFIFIILFFALFSNRVHSQEVWPFVTEAVIDENGDTLAVVILPEFVKFAPPHFKNAFQERRYNRLVRNVKVAYPYAKLAGIMLRDYEEQLALIDSEYERRKLMRKAEAQIQAEFEDDLRNMTVSQGWILLKLIDRETGHTSYDLLSEFRGKFRAFFWQTFAGLFGFDLKTKYDPYGADKDIEYIVIMIEAGAI